MIKKILGVLMHLSEHRGRNLYMSNTDEENLYQEKSEELKEILINNWDNKVSLNNKFREFQKSLNNNRKKQNDI